MHQYKDLDYIKKSKERLITAVSNSTDNIKDKQNNNKNRKLIWEEKQLYRYFKQHSGEISHEKT